MLRENFSLSLSKGLNFFWVGCPLLVSREVISCLLVWPWLRREKATKNMSLVYLVFVYLERWKIWLTNSTRHSFS